MLILGDGEALRVSFDVITESLAADSQDSPMLLISASEQNQRLKDTHLATVCPEVAGVARVV